MLAAIEGIEDLSLTTNAYLLERDADALVAAGIERVNVSIDSLARDRFFQITRRDALPQVLRGLEAIGRPRRGPPDQGQRGRDARLHRAARSAGFVELARTSDYQVRFIEFMPLDADHAWTADSVLTGEEIRALIEREHPLVELRARALGDRARLRASPTVAARSASSTPSASRSAPTATACG